ncbi:MAG TPA: 1-phosphofructokinase family hexose kinase [Chthonomonadaceae bacterium]|nr:1-phosphofructokinase family hexose kinase [Chthonomonadaceae bacterium]
MLLIVTPNAGLDKTYRIEDFCLDRLHRSSQALTVAGGKGLNVARVYQKLGGETRNTGFLGGLNGRLIARILRQEGTADDFVRVRGESRLCIAVVDPRSGAQTEINEQGPEVSARAVRALRQRVADLLARQRFAFLVLAGSLPPQAPDTLYADLIEIARRSGTPAVLDSSGAALKEGLRARPWMVKPNRVELESIVGLPLPGLQDTLEAARQLHAEGVALVAATRGAEGALLVCEEGAWLSTPPPIPFVSAVASGDTFLAAFLWEWGQGALPGDPASALRLATGAGAANAAVLGAGACTPEEIAALAAQTQVRRLR